VAKTDPARAAYQRPMGTLRIALTGAALLVVLAAAGGAQAQSPTLSGVVGPGFSIKLSDAAGAAVKNLDPGTYTIRIQDASDIHNFHLTGPGVNMATDVEQTGTFTWTVTFSAGTYHFQCDPHASTMFGNFTVGGAAPPTTTTTPPKPKPAPVRLAGSVGPGKRIALTRAGVRFASVKAGLAVVVVKDRSAIDNFRLIGPGVNRATTRAGRATVTWRVALKKGRYVFRSDATPTLKGAFRVR
jgi:plastocyanin